MFWIWNVLLTYAFAAPPALTYQGRIVKSDGQPLQAASVSFQFEITSADGACVLYREQVNGINMQNSLGVFDIPIGTSHSYPGSASFTILDSFNNSGTLVCDGGAPFTPTLDTGRLLRVQFHDGSSWKLITPDVSIRSVPYAGYAESAAKLGANLPSDFVLKSSVNGNATCDSGSFLTWNATTRTFGCDVAPAGGGGGSGTVTNVTSANSYLSIINGTTTPQLTLNVGTGANTVAAGNDSRFTDSRNPTGSATGDLSGNYPNPTVAKIQGRAIDATAPTDGQVLLWDNGSTTWKAQFVRAQDLRTAWGGTQMIPSTACAANEAMVWSVITDRFACQAISSLNASSITAGTLNTARLGSGTADNTTYLRGDGTWAAVSTSDSTKLPLAGGTMSGNIAMGGNKITGIGNVPFTAANPTGTEDGKSLRWNNSTTQWEWFTAGAAGSGIASLNGLSGTAQTIAPTSSATSYGFNSTGTSHTLVIPSAATAGVTAGTISKTEYDTFNAKQAAGNYITTLSGDISSSGFAAGTVTTTIANSAVTTAKINDGAVTGVKLEDVSGLTPGTYPKVTVDAKGRVTTGTTLSASDIPSLDAAKITTGTMATARLGSGTADNTTYLRGDGTWAAASVTETDPKVGANTTNYVSKWNGSALVASGIFESAGNVGIGTATPSEALHVVGNAEIVGNVNAYTLTAGEDAWAPLTVNRHNISNTSEVVAEFARGRADATAPGLGLEGILALSAESKSNRAVPVSGIKFGWENAQSNDTTDRDGYVAFSTVLNNGSSATAGTERMRITSSGNVGIGTATPGRLIHLRSNSSTTNPGINIESTDTGGRGYSITSTMSTSTVGVGKFVIGDETAGAARIVMDSTGNVGIGTNSPGALLEVAGQIKITGGTPGANKVLTSDGTGLATWQTPSSGSVTSVVAGTGLTGGTITTTGTIGLGTELTGLNGLSTTGFVKRTGAGAYSTSSAMTLTSDVTGVLPIANGGTNSSTALNNNRLMASVSGAIQELGALADGQIVVGKNASAPQVVTLGGDATISNTGSLTLGTGAVTTGKILDGTVAVGDLNFAGAMAINTGLVVRDGTQFYNKTCSGNEALIWSVANGWICSAITLTESDPKVGANTTNYLSKWNGSALVASGIYQAPGGAVGLGTASPTHQFEITGAATTTPQIFITNTTATDYSQMAFASASRQWNIGIGNGSESAAGVANKFYIWDNNAAAMRMVVDTSGNVGIGNANPQAAMHVTGTANETLRIESSNNIGTGINLINTTTGAHTYQFFTTGSGNGSGAGLFGVFDTTANMGPLAINGLASKINTNSVGQFGWSTSNQYADGGNDTALGRAVAGVVEITNGTAGNLRDLNLRALNPSSGNVGVGTTSPSQKLHVVGNIKASGQVASGSQTITSGATSTINWNNGNAISTNYDCSSNLIMDNLSDGGTYTLAITDPGTTQCNFSTTTTGTDAGTVSYRFKPANDVRDASTHTVYTLMRVGSVVYVSWGSGF